MLTQSTKTSLAAAFVIVTAISIGHAQTSPSATTGTATAKSKELPKKPIDKVTCEDFNALEDTFKPRVIAWAAGYQQGQKKPDVVVMDMAGVEKIAPVVIGECTRSPSASFWSKVDAELKKVF